MVPAPAQLTELIGERPAPDVWDQIRRTEEELMEMGTMDQALLQDHSVETGETLRVTTGLRTIGKGEGSIVTPLFH